MLLSPCFEGGHPFEHIPRRYQTHGQIHHDNSVCGEPTHEISNAIYPLYDAHQYK